LGKVEAKTESINWAVVIWVFFVWIQSCHCYVSMFFTVVVVGSHFWKNYCPHLHTPLYLNHPHHLAIPLHLATPPPHLATRPNPQSSPRLPFILPVSVPDNLSGSAPQLLPLSFLGLLVHLNSLPNLHRSRC
jgi:hypothetical protein